MIVKNRAEEIVSGIQAEEAVANEKLAAAEPALRAAEEALNTIKAADIATVRKLAKPPHLIMRIMDCILLLFQENIQTVTQDPERESPTPSWSDALKLMSQSTFLFNLLNFNKVSHFLANHATLLSYVMHYRMQSMTKSLIYWNHTSVWKIIHLKMQRRFVVTLLVSSHGQKARFSAISFAGQ